jgi:hypothetical protein
MSYTSINTAIETISNKKIDGFISVSKLKIGSKLRIGIDRQEGDDSDGYQERDSTISAIMPNGNGGVYISFLGVYADNAIELNLNQFVKVVK